MANLEWYLEEYVFQFEAIHMIGGITVRIMYLLSISKLQGTLKLSRLAKELAGDVNVKRRAKGLLPRPVSFLRLLIVNMFLIS